MSLLARLRQQRLGSVDQPAVQHVALRVTVGTVNSGEECFSLLDRLHAARRALKPLGIAVGTPSAVRGVALQVASVECTSSDSGLSLLDRVQAARAAHTVENVAHVRPVVQNVALQMTGCEPTTLIVGGSLLDRVQEARRSAQNVVGDVEPTHGSCVQSVDSHGSLLDRIQAERHSLHRAPLPSQTCGPSPALAMRKRSRDGMADAYRPELVKEFRRFRGSYRSRMRSMSSDEDDGDSSPESDLDELQEAEISDLLRDSAPDSTLLQDDSHVRTWTSACKQVGINPWRLKPLRTSKQRRREMKKLAYATWIVHKNMRPRCKKDPAAKPDSAYQVYLGMRREHERLGYTMADGKFVIMAIKSMNKRFIKKWGYASLSTKRKEPLTRRMIVAFMSLKEGTKLGCIRVSNKSRGYKSWRCLNATSAQTGLRKDEVACKTKAQGLTKVQLTRASLVFTIRGKEYADPGPELLGMMDETGGVKLKPRPSKADQKGAFWCDKPIFLPYRRDDPVCAARELVEQELMFPVRGIKRASVPLFADDKGAPFSKSQVTTAFLAMLKLVVPATDVNKYSFHGYRIYLACALDAVDCPPDKIKRILRWVSDEALQTYVRGGDAMFTSWLDRSKTAVINSVQVSNLPSLNAMQILAECPEDDDAYDSDD